GQDLPFGRIRVTVTSGSGPLGSSRGDAGQTVVVITEPCPRPPAVTAIATVPWPRNERGALAGLKTTSYAENALMVENASRRGASEAVMPNTAGMLCEGTGSNIFYVLGDEIVTPTLRSGCLAGVTRALLLQWCAGTAKVVERDEPIEVLQRADEVFLVSTTRDVQAVERVDDRVLDAPGEVTVELGRLWTRESLKHADP
ncbi:MAG: aminotransferase class IV, partial [Nocardioidaceae bacterium]